MKPKYDAAFFKVLARNDTGETGSHQAGVVLPKTLAQYFPHLAVGDGPTADHEITADLYDGSTLIETVETRYQIQTWGGERSPEHRLTRNLRPILNRAKAGDILLFQRQLGTLDKFRLTLIHQGSPEFLKIAARANTAPVVTPQNPPATQDDFKRALESIETALLKPFIPTEPAELKLTLVQRRVRTELFQRSVRLAYANICVLCGKGMVTPNNTPEVEAAHIIPRGADGTNDPRNGLALCRSHHWAFDRLLWTVTPEQAILVPRRVASIAANAELANLADSTLHAPQEQRLAPAFEAIEHHRKRTIDAWGN